MSKALVLALLSLSLCSACSNSILQCPKRVPFTGTTYGDLVYYTSDLEQDYDSCSK